MQGLLRGAIAASMLLGAAGTAQAAKELDVRGFSAQLAYSFTPELFDMTVVSDTGNSVSLALSGVSVNEYIGGIFRYSSEQRGGLYDEPLEENVGYDTRTALNFHAKAGYRIGSLTLTGTTTGTLTPAVIPPNGSHPGEDREGSAHSTAGWWLSTDRGAMRPGVVQRDLTGSESFSLQYDNASDDEFIFTIDSWMHLAMRSAYTQWPQADFPSGSSYSSSGSLEVRDIVLTVNLVPIAAVPEPGTYAMLLAGLALVGGVAARRCK